MMKIGIVIAIARELQAFLESEYTVEALSVRGREAYRTEIAGNEVYAVKSGCGQIDAASATQLLISEFDCEVILNFGVTGALREELAVADLFVATGAVNYDYDVSPIDPVVKNQYEEFADTKIPFDEGLIALAKQIRPDLREAVVASGEKFVELQEAKIALRELGCDICDMEAAAIARTAFLNGVRALSIKCISDTFDGDGSDFVANVTASAAKAFALLREILHRI